MRAADPPAGAAATEPPRSSALVAALAPGRLPGRVVLLLVALALAARGAHLERVRDTAMMEYHHTYAASDMALMAGWGERLAAGDWLGRTPYHPLAGWQLRVAPEARWRAWYGDAPVYFKAPFYGYLIALALRLFGDAMPALAVLQVIASAAAVALLAAATARTLGVLAGGLAGALFALYAPAIHYDVVLLRGTWIVLAAVVATWLLVRLREVPTAPRALALGVAAGAAVLVNEGFTLLPPLLLATLPLAGGPRRWLRLAGAFAAGALLALAPLVARNLAVGAPPASLMVTAGTAYAIHNSGGASPLFYDSNPPGLAELLDATEGGLLATAAACLRSFDGPRDVLGFYLRKAVGLVVPFENPDNVSFYYARRLSPSLRLLPTYALVWPLAALGLVLATRRWRHALPWLPAIAALTAGILVTIPLSRYRAALVPLLIPFAGLALAVLVAAAGERRWRRVAAMVAAMLCLAGLAAVLQREVLFATVDRALLEYRPAEHILGATFHGERGDVDGAARELGVLVRRHPDPAVKVHALLLLAEIAADGGRPAVAGQALEAAAGLGAGSPGVLLAVGDLYRLRLRDRDRALAQYRRAAALDRNGALDAAIRQRLAALARPG